MYIILVDLDFLDIKDLHRKYDFCMNSFSRETEDYVSYYGQNLWTA